MSSVLHLGHGGCYEVHPMFCLAPLSPCRTKLEIAPRLSGCVPIRYGTYDLHACTLRISWISRAGGRRNRAGGAEIPKSCDR